ncbi:hypothetical protein LCGC14_1156440 [marine sediment metagenome]|uniref:Uncharacterized protein n=1 Tax=marine sediment metagenome TaxID=412755 RepID=A0A0F9MH07_9ZZZZ
MGDTATKRKPWWRSKKVWGVIGATLIGLFAPGLGVAWTQTLSVMLALATGRSCSPWERASWSRV